MYTEKLKHFANVKNLGGKAWEHAKVCDWVGSSEIDDCAMHCFHFQQLFELLFKHILETRTEFGAYPLIHKLDRLLKQVVKETDFNVETVKYTAELNALTMCAESYRYNFLLNCETYKETVKALNPLLDELAEFSSI